MGWSNGQVVESICCLQETQVQCPVLGIECFITATPSAGLQNQGTHMDTHTYAYMIRNKTKLKILKIGRNICYSLITSQIHAMKQHYHPTPAIPSAASPAFPSDFPFTTSCCLITLLCLQCCPRVHRCGTVHCSMGN